MVVSSSDVSTQLSLLSTRSCARRGSSPSFSPPSASSPVAPWASPSDASLLGGVLTCDVAPNWPSGGWDLTRGSSVSTTSSSRGTGLLAGVARLTPSVVLAVVTVPGPLGAAAASSSTLPRVFAPFSATLLLVSTLPWFVIVRSRSRRVPFLGESSRCLLDPFLTSFVERAATRVVSLCCASCTVVVVVVVVVLSNRLCRYNKTSRAVSKWEIRRNNESGIVMANKHIVERLCFRTALSLPLIHSFLGSSVSCTILITIHVTSDLLRTHSTAR